MKRQKKHNIGRWTPMSEGVQYATGEWQRAITNSSRKNEVTGPKQKWHSVMDGSGGERKVQCCKEQYWLGKLDVVKQKIARVNIDILGISELNYLEMGKFNSDDHYIYYCGQESLGRNRAALIVNKRVQNAVFGCNLKKDRMILVCFQGKPFNITVRQVYAWTTDAEEAEVDKVYEDLQDLQDLTPKKKRKKGRGIQRYPE